MAPRTRKEETREEERKQAQVEVEIEEIRICEQLEYLNSIFYTPFVFPIATRTTIKIFNQGVKIQVIKG